MGVAAQDHEIERLQEHVTELGVADADLAVFHAGANGFLGDHLIDGKMFSDVAQEIEEGNTRRPARVVHESRRVLFGFKIQQFRQLHFYAGDVGIEDFFREQLTLLRFSTGIADGTGRATGDSDRMVAK